MRLIDADALLEQYGDPYTDYIDGDDVRNAPTIDAVPVVHGKWKWSHGGQCSECGYHNSNFDYNYCPNCGAKMDGKENTDADN